MPVQAAPASSQVSRHLRVLREVGAVDVRDHGRQRLYRINPKIVPNEPIVSTEVYEGIPDAEQHGSCAR